MNGSFFRNFSGFSGEGIFTVGDMALFSAAISNISRRVSVSPEEWYTSREKQEIEGIKSPKRNAEKLAGKYCAKQAISFFMQRKRAYSPPFGDFSIIAKDHPVQLVAETTELSEMLPGIFCSISHSADIAVAAVSPCAVGVDIEALRRLPDNMTDSILSGEEQAYFYNFMRSAFELSEDFFTIAAFTCKEAVLKSIGCGIAGGLLQVRLGSDFSSEGSLAASYGGQLFRIYCLFSGGMFLSLASPELFQGTE